MIVKTNLSILHYKLLSFLLFIFIIPFYGGGIFRYVNIFISFFILELFINGKQFRFTNTINKKIKIFKYFIVTFIILLFFSKDILVSFLVLINYIVVFISLLFIYNSISYKNIRIVIRVGILVFLVEYAFAVGQYFGFEQFSYRTKYLSDEVLYSDNGIVRAYGTFGHSLAFVGFMLPIALSLFAYFFFTKKAFFSFLSFLVSISLIIISGSRGALFSFFCSILILVLLFLKFSDKIAKKKFFVGITTIVILIIIFGFVSIDKLLIFERFTSTDVSNIDRVDIFSKVLPIVYNNFLFGVGSGNIKQALIEYKINVNDAVLNGGQVENAYLNIMIENGLIGLLLFLNVIFLPLYLGFKHILKYSTNRPLIISSIIFLITVYFMMLSNTAIFGFKHSICFMFYYALILKSIKY